MSVDALSGAALVMKSFGINVCWRLRSSALYFMISFYT